MNRISASVLLASAVLATGIAALLTSWVRVWARDRLLDIPNERSSHVAPTPRGGGLALVAVMLGGLLWYAVRFATTGNVAGYVAGALLIAVVSFIDDVRPVASGVRLLAHSAAALVAIGAYTDWQGAALPFLDATPGLAAVLTFMWIVGLTNAFNFMDGIDGLAGAQAVTAGLTWCAIGVLVSNPVTAWTGMLAAAASAGFLLHNWPPARIFMGDVGAAFLGYTFAVLPLLTDPLQARIGAAGALLVGVFVFDTAFTFLRRLVAGENMFRAHRSHLYQRLVRSGHTHRTVTLFYGALAAALGGAAVLVVVIPQYALVIWLFGSASVGATLWLAVERQERRQRRNAVPHALQSS